MLNGTNVLSHFFAIFDCLVWELFLARMQHWTYQHSLLWWTIGDSNINSFSYWWSFAWSPQDFLWQGAWHASCAYCVDQICHPPYCQRWICNDLQYARSYYWVRLFPALGRQFAFTASECHPRLSLPFLLIDLQVVHYQPPCLYWDLGHQLNFECWLELL